MGNRLIIVLLSFRYIGLLNGYGCVAFRSPAFYGSYVEGDGVQAHRESEFLAVPFLKTPAGRFTVFSTEDLVWVAAPVLFTMSYAIFTCTSPAHGCACGIAHREQEQVFIGGE